jgi:hypothetical protein
MTKHEWRERSEDGEITYYRANHHAGKWVFYSTLKTDPDWAQHDMLPLPVMESLRDVLWNKHQRRRLPLKHFEQIEEILEKLKVEAGDGEEGAL